MSEMSWEDKVKSGRDKVVWVQERMPVLGILKEKVAKNGLLKGERVVITIHLEAKSAAMALAFQEAGAEVHITGSNPLSTQDDVAAYLVSKGVKVYAHYGCTEDEYNEYILRAISCYPTVIVDDGGDLISALTANSEFAKCLKGGAEETTTGIHRLKYMMESGSLLCPMVAVNDAESKCLFDNRFGLLQF